MARLFCFGLGYSARHFVAGFGARFDGVVGTVRTSDKAARLAKIPSGGPLFDTIVFDGQNASPDLETGLAQADAVLVSIPPTAAGDPVLQTFAGALRASRAAQIVYLSTVGVYGDHGGAVVDETTAPQPVSWRSQGRLAAEAAWQELGARMRVPVTVLRLAGIYGPGQNALVNLLAGRARRIVKPGQVFNRIHVADIGQAIDAAITQRASAIYNATDDEPAPPQDVVAFAAALLGLDPPAEIPFDVAARTMTPMAISFYGENKRVRNHRLKTGLGVTLRYPTYREGIRALYDAGDFRLASLS